MRATSVLLLVTLWLGGLFLAVRELDPGSLRPQMGSWAVDAWGTGTVEAAEKTSPAAPTTRGRIHILSGPDRPQMGPFRADPERSRGFLRRLLLPARALATGAEGDALRERHLLDYLLEQEPGLDSWDDPRVDPETVS